MQHDQDVRCVEMLVSGLLADLAAEYAQAGGPPMTREELIANLLDMAESYKAMRAPYDTGEELHYQDYETCIQTAEMLREDGEKC